MAQEQMGSPQQVREAWQQVMQRIAAAAVRSGRKPQDVLLVAVTKTASIEQIRALFDLGQRDFGENRVQQLLQRAQQLQDLISGGNRLADVVARLEQRSPRPGKTTAARSQAGQSESLRRELAEPIIAADDGRNPRWHMIGHLQRNKIKQVVPLVRLIHSVDTLRLAEELHQFGSQTNRQIDVLVEVNISREESKFGVAPPAAGHLCEQIHSMLHLRLRGLMTMAPYSDNPENSRPVFARCNELFQDIRGGRWAGEHFNILSMGMSNDFEVAIEEGANVVRVGRSLFGETEVA